ncbi:hypothetical protein GUJ93_ZPchr0009g2161 [Zizania palustris]|uniref:F-box domain-containing protein n=1 Tax=Zizania palustris TaxID=103762 RepID=A0A8J5R298_ZIZPA|nr:hypothetical protein GUJ93_ZPchr0009g2161 [Zizania palustris]
MGTIVSSVRRGGVGETALGDLPESCVVEVPLRLDSPEICRMAWLSRTFCDAASGDGVWQAKFSDGGGCWGKACAFVLSFSFVAGSTEVNVVGGGCRREMLRHAGLHRVLRATAATARIVVVETPYSRSSTPVLFLGMMYLMDHEKVNNDLAELTETEGLGHPA